jgi:muramoyltetrapeptide carboxypeptidase LdcA involved in peptidoglycan recycling
MENNEWFKNVCCFMIGRGKISLNSEFLKEQNKLLLNILSKYNVPIVVNCDFGHVRPFNTLITGAETTLIYKNNKYSIKYEKEL